MPVFRLLAVLAAFWAVSLAAVAADRQPASVELGQAVLPNSAVTYLDLARQLIPDLGNDGTGSDKSRLDAIRHVGGPDNAATVETIGISSIQRIDLLTKGGTQALILFDIGRADGAAQSVTVLTLFDMVKTPRLLDAMDVGTDLQTSFAEPYLLSLSSKIAVGFTHSWHLNSGEEFVGTSIIGIWDGKLHAVDTISLRNWEGCDTFVKHKLKFSKGRDVALDAVMDVSSRRQGSCDDNDRGRIDNKRYRVSYKWSRQSQTLVPGSDAFKAPLAAEEDEDQ